MNKEDRLPLFISYIASSSMTIMAFFLSLYLFNKGFSLVDIGLLMGIPILLSFLISIPIGLINDRQNSKTLIIIGLLFIGLAVISITFFSTFWLIMGFLVLKTIGMNLFSISMDSLIFKRKSLIETKKNDIFKFYTGGMGIANGLTILSCGLFFLFFNLETLIIVAGVITLFLMFLSFFLPNTEKTEISLFHYKDLLVSKEAVIFGIIIFLFALHFGPEVTNYSLFLQEVFDLTKTQMAIYMGVPILPLGISAFIFGSKMQKGMASYKVLLMGLFFNGIGHIIQAIPYLPISFLGRIIHETGDGAVMIFTMFGISILFPKEKIGGILGLNTFLKVIATFLSSLACGYLASIYNNSVPFVVAGILCLASLFLAYYYRSLLTHQQ